MPVSQKEFSIPEVREALAKSIQDRIDAYKQELVELRQRELKKSAELDKGTHNVKTEIGAPGVQSGMMNKGDKTHVCKAELCTKGVSGKTEYCGAHQPKEAKKSEDMIDLDNESDPEKRLKAVPGKHKGVLPGDKKSKVIDTSEGSGGTITKKNIDIPAAPAPLAAPGKLAALKAKAHARKAPVMAAAPVAAPAPAGSAPVAKSGAHMSLFNHKPGSVGKNPIAKAGVPMAKPAGAAGGAAGAKPPTAPAVTSAPPASKPAAAKPAPKLAGAPPAMKNEAEMEKGLLGFGSKPKSSKVESIKQAALARRAAKQPAMPKVEVLRTSGPPSGLPDKQ